MEDLVSFWVSNFQILNREIYSITLPQAVLKKGWREVGLRGRRSDVKGTGWRSGRERAADLLESETGVKSPAGFRRLRVHDLRHTFGQRLRRCGVVNETRKDLLGHLNRDPTTGYSAVEVAELYRGVEALCRPVCWSNILGFPAKLPQASLNEEAVVR